MTAHRDKATRGPTSLAETARLTGEFADWHNLLPRVTWLTGELDVGALRDAWRRVCLRHDVMRRTFISADEAYTFGDAVSELELLVANTDEEAIDAMYGALASPFDLYGPGFSRIVVVRRSERRHLLGIVLDHVISDRLSWSRLYRDFVQSYERALAGVAGDIDAQTTYHGFATQQRRKFSGDWGDQRRAFWKRYTENFGTYPPSFSVGTPRRGEPLMNVVRRNLPADAKAKVRDFSQRARATAFSVVASSVLMGMLEATGHPVAGLTVNHHGRILPGTSETVGLFVQTVPLHLRRTTSAPLEVVRDLFGQSLDVFEYFVPLRVAGSVWNLDLASSREEPGVILSFNEEVPAETNLPRLPGLVEEEIDFRIPGGKRWPETVFIEWNVYETAPQLVAHYNENVFSRSAVDQVLATAESFALSDQH